MKKVSFGLLLVLIGFTLGRTNIQSCPGGKPAACHFYHSDQLMRVVARALARLGD